MWQKIDRRLFTILMIVFVQMFGASMILPILPLYAQRQFQMPPEIITLLVSAFFAAQFIAGPSIGRLSDKYGRLPVLIVSQIGTAVSFVMIALAPNVAILFVARILDGITGGNIIVAQAYITDIMPREKRTQALGYILAAFGLGFIFGPAIGGVLSASFGARIPFLFAAVAAGATVLLTWLTLDESLTPAQREANRRFKRASLRPREILDNSLLLLVMLVAFVGQFAFGLLQSTFALYGQDVMLAAYRDSQATIDLGIGLLLATFGVTQFFTQMVLLPRMLKQFNDTQLVIIGNLLRGVGTFIFAIAVTPWLGASGAVFFALGMGFMMPTLQSLSTTTVADELRGGVLGVYQSVISLGTIASTALAGTLYAISPPTPYWISVILSGVVFLPAIVLWRRPPQKQIVIEQVTAVSD